MTTDKNEWTLLDSNFNKMAILPSAATHFKLILSEPGSGSIAIPMDSNSAALVTSGMFAAVSYRGSPRGGFSIDNIKKDYASEGNEDGGLWMQLSGSGELILLEDAIVLGTGGESTSIRDFSAPKAAALVTLIDEAKARTGCLTAVTYDFTSTADSDGNLWTDTDTFGVTIGANLLEVLRQIAKFGIEFSMTRVGNGFVLHAYRDGIGTDISETTFFRVGTNCEVANSDERGADIKNALYMSYQKGGLVQVKNDTSISGYRRREKFVDAGNAQSSLSASAYGSALLESSKLPRLGISLKVYDGVAPFVFEDYGMGDTISFDNVGVVTTYRILGIQCDWDGVDYSNVTLELNSLLQENEIHMAQDIEQLMEQWNTAHDSDLLEVRYWVPIGDVVGVSINALAVSDGGYLYAVGEFTQIGNVGATNIAQYNIATGTWAAIGTGLNATGRAVVCDGTNVYVSGDFTDADGVTVSYVAALDESTMTFSALGAGLGVNSYALALNGSELWAAKFMEISKYSGGVWTDYEPPFLAFTNGIEDIQCMVIDSGVVYVGGQFPIDGGAGIYGSDLYRYVIGTNTWTKITTTADPTTLLYALAVLDGYLYVGGLFTVRNGVANTIGLAKVDLTTLAYSSVGGGFHVEGITTRFSYALHVMGADLLIGGSFTQAGTDLLAAQHIARWDGTEFSMLDTGLDSDVFAITHDHNNLFNNVFAGGIFANAGDKPIVKIGEYITDFTALVEHLEHSSNSNFNLGEAIHGAAAKTTLANADEFSMWDSVSAALRKITWANIVTVLNTLYVSLTQTASRVLISNNAGTVTTHDGLRFDSTTGEFFVGDTVPAPVSNKSIVQGNQGASAGYLTWTWGSGFSSFISGFFANGTFLVPLTAIANDIALRLRGRFYDGVTYGGSSADIQIIATQTHSATAHGAKVIINTTPDGSTTLRQAATFRHQVAGNIEAGLVMPYVGAPVLSTLKDDFTTRGSAGVADGTLTYLSVGTSAVKVSVAAGEGYIRVSNDQQAELVFCAWAASPDLYTFSAPAAGQETAIFFGISYNAGTPIAISSSTFTDFNGHDKFWLGRASYDGTNMEILNSYAHSEDTANLMRIWMRRLFPFTRETAPEGTGGLEISDVATRQLAMTAGNVWHGFNQYIINAIAAGATFDTHYRRAGGGFVSSTATQWENTLYDDGSGTLQAMTVNRYGTRWIYLDVGKNSAVGSAYNAQLDMVYGTSNATSVANAQAELAPSIPAHLTYHGRLIGRIIFQKSAAAASVVESAWTNTFAASAVGDHNLLSNLLGGAANDYYHLTSADNAETAAWANGGTSTHTAQDAHIASTSNPHSVTAAQVGAVSLTTLQGRMFLPFGTYQDLSPMTGISNPYAVTIDRNITLKSWSQMVYVVAPNNGSNYWTLTLIRVSDGTVINTITTAAVTEAISTLITDTSFTTALVTASHVGIYISCVPTGSPGALIIFGPLVEVEV